jgi:hypothetical protein
MERMADDKLGSGEYCKKCHDEYERSGVCERCDEKGKRIAELEEHLTSSRDHTEYQKSRREAAEAKVKAILNTNNPGAGAEDQGRLVDYGSAGE